MAVWYGSYSCHERLYYELVSFTIHAKNGERVWRVILWSKLQMNKLNCCIIGLAKFFCSHEIVGHTRDILLTEVCTEELLVSLSHLLFVDDTLILIRPKAC